MNDFYEEMFDKFSYRLLERHTIDYHACVKQFANSVVPFIPVPELAHLVSQYTLYEWSCLHCTLQTMDVFEMLEHCCCQWQQESNCRGHRMRKYYCAAECLECGWGGCGCFTVHCCCPDTPPDCDRGLIHFWHVRNLMTTLDQLATSEKNQNLIDTLFEITGVHYLDEDLQWLRKIKRFRVIIELLS